MQITKIVRYLIKVEIGMEKGTFVFLWEEIENIRACQLASKDWAYNLRLTPRSPGSQGNLLKRFRSAFYFPLNTWMVPESLPRFGMPSNHLALRLIICSEYNGILYRCLLQDTL